MGPGDTQLLSGDSFVPSATVPSNILSSPGMVPMGMVPPEAASDMLSSDNRWVLPEPSSDSSALLSSDGESTIVASESSLDESRSITSDVIAAGDVVVVPKQM